jgi:hypothetical protein
MGDLGIYVAMSQNAGWLKLFVKLLPLPASDGFVLVGIGIFDVED